MSCLKGIFDLLIKKKENVLPVIWFKQPAQKSIVSLRISSSTYFFSKAISCYLKIWVTIFIVIIVIIVIIHNNSEVLLSHVYNFFENFFEKKKKQTNYK